MSTETHLSPEAYDRVKDEFDDLTTRGRIEIAEKIEEARLLGDLSENGDYHAAKEEQAKMEARIAQLGALLERAVILEEADGETVRPGCTVTIRYEGDDEEERYLIGSIEEQHDELDVMSPASPMGAALLDHSVGEVVDYEAPGGVLKVAIVAIDT